MFSRITISIVTLLLLFTNIGFAHHLDLPPADGVINQHDEDFIESDYLRQKIRISIKGNKWTPFTQTELSNHTTGISAGFSAGLTDDDNSTPLTKITTLEGLQHATNLNALYLSNNNITDLSQISNFSKLSEIHIDGNPNLGNSGISGIPITAAEGTLSVIRVDGCGITSISHFTGAKGLKKLLIGDNSFTVEHLDQLVSDILNLKDVNAVEGRAFALETLNLDDDATNDIGEVLSTNTLAKNKENIGLKFGLGNTNPSRVIKNAIPDTEDTRTVTQGALMLKDILSEAQ